MNSKWNRMNQINWSFDLRCGTGHGFEIDNKLSGYNDGRTTSNNQFLVVFVYKILSK